MANGDYISKLVQGVRSELVLPEPEVKPLVKSKSNETDKIGSQGIHELIEAIKNFEVNGDSKRLIRMDARTEEVLKLISPTFGVDVTSFVNFLCWDFLENNPELVNEIKQSIQKL
ncbi:MULTISPECIES: hypothetical protein [Algoriphagus]|jgi:hypothetical protein|uniref:Uncharacterized protein n=4 Tax=Algoriphagus TaxID=246875 RepID=A0A5C7B065_9BACT|nr:MULTISPECIES: hypothetical protein [Algoriphagus]MBB6327629.1 hypothetical protein [Algoriphagus iocasae]MDI1324462.1 hypothetical protein [Algoriphagus sp.]MDP3200818.1 hypothetical protein [Algoriphagus sp.]QYH40041.1 hypothetical protein GYM62_15040 [Algoriphagus sp. NBT04N3]TXE14151.1 hypothetical protein ESV85_00915 [Algoriphagus aquimarinus]